MHVCTVVSERFEGMMCEAAATGGQQYRNGQETIRRERDSQNCMEAGMCLQCCLTHLSFAFAFCQRGWKEEEVILKMTQLHSVFTRSVCFGDETSADSLSLNCSLMT